MICLPGAKLLENITATFPAEMKVQNLAKVLESYVVRAKVNGIVVAQSPFAVLPAVALLSPPPLGFWPNGLTIVFEINRPVKPGDQVTAEFENVGGVETPSPDGWPFLASVSVLCELNA
jgi:hypothetical protein